MTQQSTSSNFTARAEPAAQGHVVVVDFEWLRRAPGGNDVRIDIMSNGKKQWYNGNPYPGPEFLPKMS